MKLYAPQFWLCGPQARVVTVPVRAVCFNEDRRGRRWRVNYNLMLESNTISPFITPQCHGLTGSHQLVKGTHAEKARLRSVLCGTEEVQGRFLALKSHLYCDTSQKNRMFFISRLCISLNIISCQKHKTIQQHAHNNFILIYCKFLCSGLY